MSSFLLPSSFRLPRSSWFGRAFLPFFGVLVVVFVVVVALLVTVTVCCRLILGDRKEKGQKRDLMYQRKKSHPLSSLPCLTACLPGCRLLASTVKKATARPALPLFSFPCAQRPPPHFDCSCCCCCCCCPRRQGAASHAPLLPLSSSTPNRLFLPRPNRSVL